MPNICIVQPNINAYSETFLSNHAKYLEGNKFVLHGPWFPIFWGDKNICQMYLHRNLGQLIFFYLKKLLPVFIYNRLPISLSVDLQNIHLHKLAIKWFLKKNKINAVLCEYGLKGVIMKDICSELKIPIIVHFHGGDQPDMPAALPYDKGFSDLYSKAAAIITVSKSMKNRLIELGAPLSKTYFNSTGISLEYFVPTQPSLNPANFVFVGRFVDKKAPYILLLAFKEVLKTNSAKLVLIGDGPLIDVTKQLAKALKIDDSVEFKGRCSPDVVQKTLFTARAFLLHSITPGSLDREGTPNVIMEASASGLPIISTKHEGIEDAVIHGETGYLTDELDYIKMAEYINKLIENPALADELGANGRKHIAYFYDVKKNTKGLSNIILNSINADSLYSIK